MVTQPGRGDINWDVSLNAALDDLQSQATANAASIAAIGTDYLKVTLAELGLKAANGNPRLANGQSGAASGTLFMAKVTATKAATVNSVLMGIQTAGSGLTAGQNLVGLYDSGGTLLAQTADQASAWTSTDLKTMALTGGVNVTPGDYYVGLLSVGTTVPQFVRYIGSATLTAFANLGTTTATAMWSTAGTSLTALPASVAMGSRTLSAQCFWVGLN